LGIKFGSQLGQECSAHKTKFSHNLDKRCFAHKTKFSRNLDKAASQVEIQLQLGQGCSKRMGSESLIYSFIARDTVVLAEYTPFSGNFSTIAVQCLQKLPANNGKFIYSCDRHTFNYLVDDEFSMSPSFLSSPSVLPFWFVFFSPVHFYCPKPQSQRIIFLLLFKLFLNLFSSAVFGFSCFF
jgi:hypothetical protein